MQPERAAKLVELMRARITHLEQQAREIDVAMKKLPLFSWFFALVVPVGVIYGVFAAFFAALCVGSLIGVAAYLMGTRRAWYRSEAKQLAREIEDVRAEAAAGS